MNQPELLTLIQSVHAIFTFLVDCGLLASRQRCQCGTEMVLRDRNFVDGLIWESPLRTCRKRRSIRPGSFFEDSKISLGQWLNIIYLWSIRVPDRTRETLVTRLVQEFIQPGTVILSDKFSPYFNLNNIGYTDLMVNHSENFVDPYTGAHTNTIEGVWIAVKKEWKRMCGTFKHQLPSYLDEFNWQRVYPGEHFEMMLQHIAELYPVH